MCGCGDPAGIVAMVIEVLEWANSGWDDRKPLPDWHKTPAFQFVVNTLGSGPDELLEHGSSVFGSWTTKAGKARLRQLKAWGVDMLNGTEEQRVHFAVADPPPRTLFNR